MYQNRREFLKLLGAGMVFYGLSGVLSVVRGGQKPAGKRPNIVYINIDDLGWKDVGYMGSKFYETKNVDKLASEGVIFTNAYAPAANCAPSRACCMTGRRPQTHTC